MDRTTKKSWEELINLLDDSDFRDNFKGMQLLSYLQKTFILVKLPKNEKITKK